MKNTKPNAPHTPLPQSPWVLPLDGAAPFNQVGGKAHALGQLVNLGFNVPPAVVVPVHAFEQYCQYNQIHTQTAESGIVLDPAEGLLAGSAAGGVANEPAGSINAQGANSSGASQELLQGQIPPAMQQALQQAVQHLSQQVGQEAPEQEVLFAVRSSSLSEDGAAASMAGQFNTYLEVPAQQVPQKVVQCWAAMYSNIVQAYSQKKGHQLQQRMGVIIQVLINPAHAGVLFTMDPLTYNTDHLVVEYTQGLGEKLVSGHINPERLSLPRGHKATLHHLPQELAGHLETLRQEALKAEKHFACPLDIEWCATQNQLYMLQARPITTLQNQPMVIWSNVNMTENFPQPLSPFTWSVARTFYSHYMQALLKRFGWGRRRLRQYAAPIEQLTGLQGGRIYYNLSAWYQLLGAFPVGRWLRRFLDHYIGQTVPFVSTLKQPKQPPGLHLWYSLSFFTVLLWHTFAAGLQVASFEKRFYRTRRQWRKALAQQQGQPNATQLVAQVQSQLQYIRRHWAGAGVADLMVMVFPGLLQTLVQRWLPQHKQAAVHLLENLDVKSTEPSRLINQMSQALPLHSHLMELLQQQDYEALAQALPANLKQQYQYFMEQYGSRCYHECMITSPTFEEAPRLYWQLVAGYAQARQEEQAGSPLKVVHNTKAIKGLRQLSRSLPWHKRLTLRLVWWQARRALGWRERGRLCQSLLFGQIRHSAMALGKSLQQMGHLQTPEQVFGLHLHELQQLVQGQYPYAHHLQALLAQRRESQAHWQQYEPPESFLLPAGRYYSAPTQQNAPTATPQNGTWHGTAVSAGTHTAVVRVMLDPATEAPLQPGEILVTRTTDPGWTPLFAIAGGLVLERGGMLSHGAIVAREFGIPAIAGVPQATRQLKTGDVVTLNGHTGQVTLQKQATA